MDDWSFAKMLGLIIERVPRSRYKETRRRWTLASVLSWSIGLLMGFILGQII